MSPGSVTEIVHYFIAPYNEADKISSGGGTGVDERIAVLELPFKTAMTMINSGENKDGKTVLLLQHAALTQLF